MVKFQSPIGVSTSKLFGSEYDSMLQYLITSFSLLSELVLLNSTLYKACHNRAKMALCGADSNFEVFLVISASKSATNRITTLAARIYNQVRVCYSTSINYFLSFGKKKFLRNYKLTSNKYLCKLKQIN